MRNLTHVCPACDGDGIQTCNNPDHGFILAIYFNDIYRLGCPVCGHNESYKVPNGGNCEPCSGIGRVSIEDAHKINDDLFGGEKDIKQCISSVTIILP